MLFDILAIICIIAGVKMIRTRYERPWTIGNLAGAALVVLPIVFEVARYLYLNRSPF